MIKLEQLRLVNIQSWADLTIPFADGLNVIIAENNTGKSVIVKTLKLIATPRSFTRKDIRGKIRRGSDTGYCILYFSDRVIYRIAIRDDGLVYDRMEGKDVKRTIFDPPEDLIQRLSLLIESDSGYIANIIDEYSSRLMVSSESSSNYKLLEILTTVTDIENVLSNVEEKMTSVKADIKYYNDRLDTVYSDMSKFKYKDLTAAKSVLSQVELFREILSISNDLDKECDIDCCVFNEQDLDDFTTLSMILEVGYDLEEYSGLGLDAKGIEEMYVHVDLYDILNSIETIIDSNTNTMMGSIDFMKGLEILLEMNYSTMYISNRNPKLIERLDDYMGLIDCIEEIESITDGISSSNLDDITTAGMYVDVLTVLDDISSEIISIRGSNMSILNSNNNIYKLTEQLESIEVHEFICPICGGMNCCQGACVPVEG